MSKAQFRKELAQLDREQLVQLLLDVYDVQVLPKEYFEFFINPDMPKLYEKFRLGIEKELKRGKYNRSRTRVSYIKKAIKTFGCFGPEPETMSNLMAYSVLSMAMNERYYYMTDTQLRGIDALAVMMLDYGDKHGAFDYALGKLQRGLDSGALSRLMTERLTALINEYLSGSSD